MGCNSHLFIEYRRGGHWFTYAKDVDEDRDYLLYGFLAGVREDGPPVVEPRGVPEDADYHVREKFKEAGSDFHTPTWLRPSEFRKVVDTTRAERLKARAESPTWKRTEEEMKKRGLTDPPVSDVWEVNAEVLDLLAKRFGDDNVRLIVAFDN